MKRGSRYWIIADVVALIVAYVETAMKKLMCIAVWLIVFVAGCDWSDLFAVLETKAKW